MAPRTTGRWPSVARLCSYQHDLAGVKQRHCECLAYYQATEEDCELANLRAAPSWEKGVKTHYELIVKSYLGWKVYMLHTGCFASIPEMEGDTNIIALDAENEKKQVGG